MYGTRDCCRGCGAHPDTKTLRVKRELEGGMNETVELADACDC